MKIWTLKAMSQDKSVTLRKILLCQLRTWLHLQRIDQLSKLSAHQTSTLRALKPQASLAKANKVFSQGELEIAMTSRVILPVSKVEWEESGELEQTPISTNKRSSMQSTRSTMRSSKKSAK